MNAEELKRYKELLEKYKKLEAENIRLKTENLELTKEVAKLSEIANQDTLTKLSNRRAFEENSESFDSIIFCDIDHFKHINDTYGHDFGDQVLTQVAKVLKAGIRDDDLAIRYGGEEFLLMLKNCNEEQAAARAERIRISIEEAGKSQFEEGFSMSFGVAEYTDGETFENTKIRADQALYYSKEHGRNQVTRYSLMPKKTINLLPKDTTHE